MEKCKLDKKFLPTSICPRGLSSSENALNGTSSPNDCPFFSHSREGFHCFWKALEIESETDTSMAVERISGIPKRNQDSILGSALEKIKTNPEFVKKLQEISSEKNISSHDSFVEAGAISFVRRDTTERENVTNKKGNIVQKVWTSKEHDKKVKEWMKEGKNLKVTKNGKKRR